MGVRITHENGITTVVVDEGATVKGLSVRDGQITSGHIFDNDGNEVSNCNFGTVKTTWWNRFCRWVQDGL